MLKLDQQWNINMIRKLSLTYNKKFKIMKKISSKSKKQTIKNSKKGYKMIKRM